MNLYVTADQVGRPDHGGGSVTWNESRALAELGPCEVWGREHLQQGMTAPLVDDPFWWDRQALRLVQDQALSKNFYGELRLAHCYAGCLSETVRELQCLGARVGFTAAAHSIEASRKAHEELGIPYNYPHLTDPVLLKRYLRGYLEADVLICPSTHSAEVMRGFGATNKIVVIPHGVALPETVVPLPERFTVGYLGAYGPDKGVRYLLEAWKKLSYPHIEARLVLGGRDSQSVWVRHFCEVFGGITDWSPIPKWEKEPDQWVGDNKGRAAVCLLGWVENVSEFYNGISLYVQPSVSEGFGLEVLEAMAHGRPVLCSDGAGAADVVPKTRRFPAGDVDALSDLIRSEYNAHTYHWNDVQKVVVAKAFREIAADYTWPKVRERYKTLWKELLT